MNRRGLIGGLLGMMATATLAAPEALANSSFLDELFGPKRKRKKTAPSPRRVARQVKSRKVAVTKRRRPAYQGREVVTFFTRERPGTIIVRTRERALYYVLGGGKAVRYGVAVGKQGFSWAGVAKVGSKAVNPRWTPPAEMIRRTPKYARWAGGMPGGIPENPLGSRALYLYSGGRDTLYRIHGTNAPSSIGTAASSGCIRMLNHEVAELYSKTRIGAKVIVQ
jgi:lipoprotein-anchoring transpeptidase ErfK/SrfK